MKLIPLSQGLFASVDDADYEILSAYKWSAHWNKRAQRYYAVRKSKIVDGRNHSIFMHRDIMGLKRWDKKYVDHREPSETLNNQRCNLRIATPSQNAMNRRTSVRNTSGFKGVMRDKQSGRWIARIVVSRKQFYLGIYDTPELAHRAYVDAAIHHCGEFARAS